MSNIALSILIALFFNLQINATENRKNQQDNPKVMSFHIDYKETSSELCWIGAKYDTDKSSQRQNVTDENHCHPHTLFYNSIFKDKRDENLVIGEIGILHGASLLMWEEYFPEATIFGFDSHIPYINSFQATYTNNRINLATIDVMDQRSIHEAFHSTGVQYDLIIDDSIHDIDVQLRVIENVYTYLKPGGMLIMEDVYKRNNEQDYIDKLQPILHNFQDYYFVSLDHENRCSTGWDNDKLLILVKAGGIPIFKNNKKITIITPSIRPSNLIEIRESIDFDYVDEWIIVYDGSKISENPQIFAEEGNPKIKEYIHTSEGMSGNPQRNFALDHIENENTYLYFLDDDNAIHKDLYKLLNIIDEGKMYTFDQENRITGNNINLGYIDTAMLLIDFKLCKTNRWVLNEYAADFYYINECYSQNKDKWIYVNNVLCTYNSLTP